MGVSGSLCSQGNLLLQRETVPLRTSAQLADWTPPATASLWKEIGDPTVEYPEWSQPLGAHDTYALGDKVAHNGKRWVSTAANNVWEPGVYGWEEVTE